jgi:hypothetical protein
VRHTRYGRPMLAISIVIVTVIVSVLWFSPLGYRVGIWGDEGKAPPPDRAER